MLSGTAGGAEKGLEWLGVVKGGKAAVTALATAAVFLLGRPDEAAKALAALMALDLATGIAAAWRSAELSSRTGLRKTGRKLGAYLAVVAVGNLIGTIAPQLGFTRTLAIVHLGVTEGISVLENLASAGVECPGGIAEKLREARRRLL